MCSFIARQSYILYVYFWVYRFTAPETWFFFFFSLESFLEHTERKCRYGCLFVQNLAKHSFEKVYHNIKRNWAIHGFVCHKVCHEPMGALVLHKPMGLLSGERRGLRLNQHCSKLFELNFELLLNSIGCKSPCSKIPTRKLKSTSFPEVMQNF